MVNTCSTHKHYTCITGVAQLAMYIRSILYGLRTQQVHKL